MRAVAERSKLKRKGPPPGPAPKQKNSAASSSAEPPRAYWERMAVARTADAIRQNFQAESGIELPPIDDDAAQPRPLPPAVLPPPQPAALPHAIPLPQPSVPRADLPCAVPLPPQSSVPPADLPCAVPLPAQQSAEMAHAAAYYQQAAQWQHAQWQVAVRP